MNCDQCFNESQGLNNDDEEKQIDEDFKFNCHKCNTSAKKLVNQNNIMVCIKCLEKGAR